MGVHAEHAPDALATVKDPVCGMDVDRVASTHRAEYAGQTHHFCSEHCQATFEADPGSYLDPHAGAYPDHRAASSAPTSGDVADWTCPMHPEIRQSMFTLIAMGTGVAWLFSVVATVAPGLFPDASRTDGAVAVYYEAAAVITTLVLVGQVLELRARDQTSGAIRALLDLTPKTAHRINPAGTEEEVSLDLVQIGDLLRVPPRREGLRRRHRRGRALVAGRVTGHRRVDADHQDCRRHRCRWHPQPDRFSHRPR